ncbi:MAG: hypothetical protein ACR2N5_07295 [Solirubrobacterales bacterium]
MSKVKFRLPSPALFISVIALFIALGAGAYAASLPDNSVGTPQLKNKAVENSKIERRTIGSARIANQSIKTKSLERQVITTGKLADLAVENRKLLSPTLWGIFNGSAGDTKIVISNLDSSTGAGPTGITRDSEGKYTITWAPQDPSISGIDGCTTLATAADTGSKRWAQAEIDDTGGPTFESIVQIRDEAGDPKDAKFTATLLC